MTAIISQSVQEGGGKNPVGNASRNHQPLAKHPSHIWIWENLTRAVRNPHDTKGLTERATDATLLHRAI